MRAIRSTGFIGGGRIASILLGGWDRSATMPGRVVVFDPDAGVAARLKARHPRVETASLADAASQEAVFLAVHPPVIPQVLSQVRSSLSPGAMLVSLAPKFSMAKLTELLGGFRRIARMIPTAASLVGQGYNPMALGEALDERDRSAFRDLVAGLGASVEVPEAHLETYAVITAMGPTFLWPQVEMLAALAESSGLSRAVALAGIEKMLTGAVATLRDAGLPPAEVQDLVPVKPLGEEVGAFVGAARPKLEGLLAKLRP